MSNIDRRSALSLGLAAVALSSACANASQTDLSKNDLPQTQSSQGNKITYTPKPLSFDPSKVTGLSEKLIRSHHEKNYSGAVRRLGKIQSQLASADMGALAGFELNGLKREELMALNSMYLHEIYFAGFNDIKSPSEKLGQQIERDFGSLDQWSKEFTAMGHALGGGSGWVLLTWSPRANRLMNLWAADHTHTAGDGNVLIALDMYEHAYAVRILRPM